MVLYFYIKILYIKIYVKYLHIKIYDRMKVMKSDFIDGLIKQWSRERPDLDSSAINVVGRILRLSTLLQRRGEASLEPLNLTLWQYEVLAALRRVGQPFRLSPTQLRHAVVLSSGAMTNRIDRLETAGLVKRVPDSLDRRGLQIVLTSKGLELINRAIEARLQDAEDVVRFLSHKERQLLEPLLRKLLAEIEGNSKSRE